MIPFGDDVSVKSLTDIDFLGLGTRPALWVDGVLTAPTSSSFMDSIGAQAELFKAVFTVVQSSASGWTKLGTFTGSSGGRRFRIDITGKQGWNDQNFPGHAIIYGSSNFIGTDTGQIAGGAGWIEFEGSASVMSEVRLVRQAGYAPQTFDVLIRQGSSSFVQWVVEFTTSTKTAWATDVQYNFADPGTGTNVMQVARKLAWDSANLPVTSFAKTLLDDADAASGRATLGAAPLASPAFTGIPTAPTAASGTNTTQLATTAYVRTAIADLVDSSPGALDTLNELAAALGDDPNFATTVTNSLAGKFGGSGTTNAIPKVSASMTLADSLLSDTGTEIRQASGLRRFYNPNLTDYALAFTRGTAAAPDGASAWVARMDGMLEWGPGGSVARNVNLYYGGTNKLKSDDIFWAVSGFRSTGYNSGDLSGTGPGVEVHYDSAGLRARVLAYDRTAAQRIELALDGSPINFYANGNLRAALDASGNFSLTNYAGNRALVSNGSKQLVESTATAAQIAYLDTLTGNVQTQLNGKPHKDDVNFGTTFDSTFDPLSDRFVSSSIFDLRGGVRTMFTYGPFSGSKVWYNVVDVRHRNGSADGATGYGGELVWGMTASQTRMAFRSRAVDGTPTAWAEVWTNSNLASPATESWANATFQPKEDQRLRTTDYVSHAGVYATDFVFGANSVSTDGQISYWENAPYTEIFNTSGTMQTAHAIIDADSTTVVLDLPSAPRSGWGSPLNPILTISVPKLRLMGTDHSIRHPEATGVIKGLNLNNMSHYSNRSVPLKYCGVYTVTMVSRYIYCVSPFWA